MLNEITIMGRLTRDPEMRKTNSGKDVCSFSIAVDRDGTSGDNKKTDFFDVTAWNKSAEFAAKHLRKGQLCVVKGAMHNNPFTDKETGKTRPGWGLTSQGIYPVFDNKGNNNAGGDSAAAPASVGASNGFTEIPDADDGELPF